LWESVRARKFHGIRCWLGESLVQRVQGYGGKSTEFTVGAEERAALRPPAAGGLGMTALRAKKGGQKSKRPSTEMRALRKSYHQAPRRALVCAR